MRVTEYTVRWKHTDPAVSTDHYLTYFRRKRRVTNMLKRTDVKVLEIHRDVYNSRRGVFSHRMIYRHPTFWV